MNIEARHFRLGLFVIGGAVLLALAVSALTAGRLFRKTHPLYCYFQENVQGLDQGGAVKFRGVEVGHIESVNVVPRARIAAGGDDVARDSYTIEVVSKLFVDKISDDTGGSVDPSRIDEAIALQVKKGLRVRIAWKDITGQKYLELDYVDPTKSPPPPIPFEPTGAYIPTSVEKSITDIQRDVAAVTSGLAQVDFKAVMQDVRTLMSTLQKKVEQLDVKHVADAADAVRDLAKDPRIDEALVRMQRTLEGLESTAKRVDEILSRPAFVSGVDDAAAAAASLKRISTQLEDSLPKLTASVEDTLASARRAIDESRLSDTTAAARAAVADVGATARQIGALRDSAKKTLADLDQASRGLAQLVKYVEENPNALLHGKMEDPR
jgi:paraquat-inducible protein B